MTDGEVNLHQQLISAIEHQKRSTVTVLSCLLSVQDSVGYIPSEAIDIIANKMDTTINDVWGVASFYTNFRFTPPKSSTIEICWGPTCHLLGATKILETTQNELEKALKGKFVSCNVQYRDENTDALVCNVFIQKPPEGF